MDYDLAQRAFELRKQWPKILVLESEWGKFIWRPLVLSEFEAAVSMVSAYPAPWVNDFLVRSVLLFSEPEIEYYLNEGPGGVVDHLAELIIKNSGFYSQDFAADVKSARLELQKVHNTLQAFILKAFPQLPGLRSFTYEQLLEWFARAEGILGQVPLDEPKKKKKPRLRRSPEELIKRYPEILSPEAADKFIPQ